jgi:hypothetical protein
MGREGRILPGLRVLSLLDFIESGERCPVNRND